MTEKSTMLDPTQTSSGASILIVDDEPSFCVVVAEILELFGYTVRQAHNVQEALQHLEVSQPDLVLTDIMMPEDDGLALIRKLRAGSAFARVPIIVVSAIATEEKAEEALAAGANTYISKPFSASDLRTAIADALTA